MKLNKLLFVGLAVLGLMVSGCANKHEVETGNKHEVETGGDTAAKSKAPTTHAVKSAALKPDTNTVSFAFDSAALDDAGRAILDAYVAWLGDHGAVQITVEGNCDQRGSREYNLALGQQRADGVKQYLVAHGVDASRIKTASYGEERLACSGTGEACWAENRRADIVSK